MARRVLSPAPLRPELDDLLKRAAQIKMTPEEMFEQRISFVYGSMDNPNVTRAMIRERVLAELPDKRLLIQAEEAENDCMEAWGW